MPHYYGALTYQCSPATTACKHGLGLERLAETEQARVLDFCFFFLNLSPLVQVRKVRVGRYRDKE